MEPKRIALSDELTGKAVSEIKHYGILGMRWGVRRQPDGSKVRTGSPQDSSSGYEPKNPGIGQGGKPAKPGSRSAQRAKAKSMTDQELRDRINRINMEKTYVSLTSNPSVSSQLRNEASKVLSNVGRNIVTQQLTNHTNSIIKEYLR